MITKSDNGTLIHSDLNIEDEYLMHYGVKGMKWKNHVYRRQNDQQKRENADNGYLPGVPSDSNRRNRSATRRELEDEIIRERAEGLLESSTFNAAVPPTPRTARRVGRAGSKVDLKSNISMNRDALMARPRNVADKFNAGMRNASGYESDARKRKRR